MSDSRRSERANFAKLSRLIVDGGRLALQKVFDRLHPPGTLRTAFNSNHATLNGLLKRRILSSPQWQMLFPSNSSAVPKSSCFDITLLFVLLRNICGLHPPASGWDSDPPRCDESLEANLTRIKWFRNKLYAHVTSTRIDETSFNTYWAELSNTLVQLGLDEEEIDTLRMSSFEEGKEYIDLLFKWKCAEDELKQKVEVVIQNQENLLDVVTHKGQFSKEKTIGNMKFCQDEAHILGKGCKGTKVYTGVLLPSGKGIAVKRMYSELYNIDEALKLKTLDHPNIIKCLAVEKDDEFICLGLELCGKTLRRCVEMNEFGIHGSDVDRLGCLRNVSEAVEYLHERNIRHRDIKPDNILLSSTSPPQFVLADFNLARESSSNESSSTQFGSIVGTYGYMAPEVTNELCEKTTVKMDIFSLGCVFYYVLTDKGHPFGSLECLKRCQDNINKHKKPSLCENVFIECAWIKSLIEHMISFEVMQRPTAAEVVKNLKKETLQFLPLSSIQADQHSNYSAFEGSACAASGLKTTTSATSEIRPSIEVCDTTSTSSTLIPTPSSVSWDTEELSCSVPTSASLTPTAALSSESRPSSGSCSTTKATSIPSTARALSDCTASGKPASAVSVSRPITAASISSCDKTNAAFRESTQRPSSARTAGETLAASTLPVARPMTAFGALSSMFRPVNADSGTRKLTASETTQKESGTQNASGNLASTVGMPKSVTNLAVSSSGSQLSRVGSDIAKLTSNESTQEAPSTHTASGNSPSTLVASKPVTTSGSGSRKACDTTLASSAWASISDHTTGGNSPTTFPSPRTMTAPTALSHGFRPSSASCVTTELQCSSQVTRRPSSAYSAGETSADTASVVSSMTTSAASLFKLTPNVSCDITKVTSRSSLVNGDITEVTPSEPVPPATNFKTDNFSPEDRSHLVRSNSIACIGNVVREAPLSLLSQSNVKAKDTPANLECFRTEAILHYSRYFKDHSANLEPVVNASRLSAKTGASSRPRLSSARTARRDLASSLSASRPKTAQSLYGSYALHTTTPTREVDAAIAPDLMPSVNADTSSSESRPSNDISTTDEMSASARTMESGLSVCESSLSVSFPVAENKVSEMTAFRGPSKALPSASEDRERSSSMGDLTIITLNSAIEQRTPIVSTAALTVTLDASSSSSTSNSGGCTTTKHLTSVVPSQESALESSAGVASEGSSPWPKLSETNHTAGSASTSITEADVPSGSTSVTAIASVKLTSGGICSNSSASSGALSNVSHARNRRSSIGELTESARAMSAASQSINSSCRPRPSSACCNIRKTTHIQLNATPTIISGPDSPNLRPRGRSLSAENLALCVLKDSIPPTVNAERSSSGPRPSSDTSTTDEMSISTATMEPGFTARESYLSVSFPLAENKTSVMPAIRVLSGTLPFASEGRKRSSSMGDLTMITPEVDRTCDLGKRTPIISAACLTTIPDVSSSSSRSSSGGSTTKHLTSVVPSQESALESSAGEGSSRGPKLSETNHTAESASTPITEADVPSASTSGTVSSSSLKSISSGSEAMHLTPSVPDSTYVVDTSGSPNSPSASDSNSLPPSKHQRPIFSTEVLVESGLGSTRATENMAFSSRTGDNWPKCGSVIDKVPISSLRHSNMQDQKLEYTDEALKTKIKEKALPYSKHCFDCALKTPSNVSTPQLVNLAGYSKLRSRASSASVRYGNSAVTVLPVRPVTAKATFSRSWSLGSFSMKEADPSDLKVLKPLYGTKDSVSRKPVSRPKTAVGISLSCRPSTPRSASEDLKSALRPKSEAKSHSACPRSSSAGSRTGNLASIASKSKQPVTVRNCSPSKNFANEQSSSGPLNPRLAESDEGCSYWSELSGNGTADEDLVPHVQSQESMTTPGISRSTVIRHGNLSSRELTSQSFPRGKSRICCII